MSPAESEEHDELELFCSQILEDDLPFWLELQELEDEADEFGWARVGVCAADGLQLDSAVNHGGRVERKAVFLCGGASSSAL